MVLDLSSTGIALQGELPNHKSKGKGSGYIALSVLGTRLILYNLYIVYMLEL